MRRPGRGGSRCVAVGSIVIFPRTDPQRPGGSVSNGPSAAAREPGFAHERRGAGRSRQVSRVSWRTNAMQTDWNSWRDRASAEVDATLAELPGPLREQACKLPVTFEHVPNAELQADGIEPDTLGLFAGAEFADEGSVPMPPQIILFLDNLRDVAKDDPEIFREEVRITLLHELGHYLGLDEDDLIDRGLE